MHYIELCGIRTRSPRMLALFEAIRRTAPLETPLLIRGETGTGKELVATAIHRLSARAQKALVTLNCGALSETLAESELFGHERGAFTGADRTYGGRIEAAAGGTLFLDEVDSLPLPVQPKLLRFLEHGEVQRIGRAHPTVVDVRVVSASNAPLEQAVEAHRMRADLLYRLDVLTLELPPLRERLEDLPVLAAQFLAEDPVARQLGIARPSKQFISELSARSWPGNVRELRSVIRRALVFGGAESGMLIRVPAGPGTGSPAAPPDPCTVPRGSLPPFKAWMRECEREYLHELVALYRTQSARMSASGLPPRTLYRRLRALRSPEFEPHLCATVLGQEPPDEMATAGARAAALTARAGTGKQPL